MELPRNYFLLQKSCSCTSNNHKLSNKHALFAESCLREIGGRYLIDAKALQEYIENTTLEESSFID